MVAVSLFASVLVIKRVADRRAAQKRRMAYQSVLDEYSHELKPGTNAGEVESYLHLEGHHVSAVVLSL